jgi:hypothetical protein
LQFCWKGKVLSQSRVQMKSSAGKALETVNCAFLKRRSINWSMLTANIKNRIT